MEELKSVERKAESVEQEGKSAELRAQSSEQISEHISYEEATRSHIAEKLGIDNTPPEEIVEVMKVTAAKIFEPLRRFWKTRIYVSRFYSAPAVQAFLTKQSQASAKSQHPLGEAMDLDAHVYGMISNRQIFEYIRDNCIFDQLIWEEGDSDEPAWVHVSYCASGNRMEVLRSIRNKKKVRYVRL